MQLVGDVTWFSPCCFWTRLWTAAEQTAARHSYENNLVIVDVRTLPSKPVVVCMRRRVGAKRRGAAGVDAKGRMQTRRGNLHIHHPHLRKSGRRRRCFTGMALLVLVRSRWLRLLTTAHGPVQVACAWPVFAKVVCSERYYLGAAYAFCSTWNAAKVDTVQCGL